MSDWGTIYERVEGLTHALYNDMRTCCGIYTNMTVRTVCSFAWEGPNNRPVTCLPCLGVTGFTAWRRTM